MQTIMSMRLPKGLLKNLDVLADRTERPRSYLVRKALETYLAEYGDYVIARERMADETDEVISSAELRRRIVR